MNPLWFRLATSTNTVAAASPEMTEERRRYFFEPILPAASRAPWSPIGRAASKVDVEAEASPPVAPGPQFDIARIPIMPPPIQRKATVSSPGDPLEREADEVADKVMRMAEPAPIGSAPAAIQRKCAACEDEEKKTIQTKRALSANAEAVLDAGAAVRVAERGGEPLPKTVRDFFEPRLGHDFSRVRVHADGEAADAARAVQARAYTVGSNIVFGRGEYTSGTAEGRRLLAHELTHVAQRSQSGGLAQRGVVQRQPDDTAKKDEDPLPHSQWMVKTPQVGNLRLRVVADHPTELLDGNPNTVGNLASGTVVEVVAKKNDLGWYQVTGEVRLDGGKRERRTGFVHRKYLFPVSAANDAKEQKTPAVPSKADEQAAPPAVNADPVLDAITSPAALIDHFTSLLILDKEALGAELRRRALRGEHALVTSVLDAVGAMSRDNVAHGFMEVATAQDVSGLLASETGRALLDRLYDELTAGSVSAEEAADADRILKAKSSRISVEQFAAAATSAKIFPLRMPGLTVLDDSPISAERRAGGKIWVKLPVRVKGTRAFATEVRTLPINVFTGGMELPEDEVVGVKLYDMGGPVVYRPALYLVELNNQTDTKILEKMVETAGLALGVVGGGAAATTSTLAKVAVWADRVAVAIGSLASIIQEHRGWIIEKFGESGKEFLRVVDVVNSVVAIYGITRAAIGAVQLFGSLRNAWRNWRAVATGLEESLSESDRGIVAKTSSSAEEVLDNAEKIQTEQRASTTGPKAAQDGAAGAEANKASAAAKEAPAEANRAPAVAQEAPAKGAAVEAKGPIASEPIEGGGKIEITFDGEVKICSSPCVRCRERFAGPLERDAALQQRLADIEKEAKRAAELQHIEATRAAGVEKAKKAAGDAKALQRELLDKTTTGDLRARFQVAPPVRAEEAKILEQKLASLEAAEQRLKELEAKSPKTPETLEAKRQFQQDLEGVERQMDVSERSGKLKIPDVEEGVPPKVAAKRTEMLEKLSQFVKEDEALQKVKAIDPNLKFGVQGSVVRGTVGNPRKPTIGKAFNPQEVDLDFFVISDTLKKTKKVVGLPGVRDRLVRRFPGVFEGLKEGGSGLSVKVFSPGEAIPEPFLILE